MQQMKNAITYFRYTNLTLSSVMTKGESVQVTATVENVGGYPGFTVANLFVDGLVADSKEVSLAPGEKTQVQFSVELTRPGIHEISVANLVPEKVKLYVDPLDSAVLILDFKEGEGFVAHDQSGFQNDATLMGQVKWVKEAARAGVQTGVDGFVELPRTSSLEQVTNTLTMTIWFHPQDEQRADFFTKGDWNVLKLRTPTELNFFAGGWERGECTAMVPENWDNNWHFIAGVVNGSNLKLYVDGILLKSVEVSGEMGPTAYNWNIGRNGQAIRGRSTNGYLGEARIFFEALSQEDIQRLMVEEELGK